MYIVTLRVLGQTREGNFVAELASLAQISNEDIQVNQLAAHYGGFMLDSDDEKELCNHFMKNFNLRIPQMILKNVCCLEKKMTLTMRNRLTIKNRYQEFHIN